MKKSYPDTPAGVYQHLKDDLNERILWFLVALSITFLVLDHFLPHDSTDAPGQRSGLAIYTDHLTGCQYVGVPGSGLTSRLDAKGHPICALTETHTEGVDHD